MTEYFVAVFLNTFNIQTVDVPQPFSGWCKEGFHLAGYTTLDYYAYPTTFDNQGMGWEGGRRGSTWSPGPGFTGGLDMMCVIIKCE